MSIVYFYIVRQAIWGLAFDGNRETVYNWVQIMYAWGHLMMKKNKDRPLIKMQLAKIVVIQVAILLHFWCYLL